MFTGTGQDRDRASRDRNGSGTAACGNGRERDWKTSPVQHSSVTVCNGLSPTAVTHTDDILTLLILARSTCIFYQLQRIVPCRPHEPTPITGGPSTGAGGSSCGLV